MSTSLTDIINKLDNSSFEKYYINFNKKVSNYDDTIKIIFDNRNSIYSNFLNTQDLNRLDFISLYIQYQSYPIKNDFVDPPDEFMYYSKAVIPSIGIFKIYYNKNLFNSLKNNKKMILLDVSLFDVKELSGHANLVILDLLNNTLFRYEPHGYAIDDPFNQIFRINILNMFSEKLGTKLQYQDSNVCNLSGLQSIESKCNYKNVWEHGYCQSWTTLYQYIMLKHNLPNNLYEKYILSLISLKTSKDINNIKTDNELSCLLRDFIKIFNLYVSEYGEKQLALAISTKNKELAKQIIKYGNTIVATRALLDAINYNDIELVTFLLESGIEPGIYDITTAINKFRDISRYSYNQTRLQNNFQIITNLINYGKININEYDSGTSLIELASSVRYWDVVKLLIEKGADVNKYVEHSSLYYALINKNIDIAMLLLEHGAIINYNLLKLCTWMDINSFNKILNNYCNNLLIEPEILFTFDRDWDKFGLLLDKINNVNVIDWIGQTPLLMALRDNYGPSLKIIVTLIEKDKDLNYFSNPVWLLDAIQRYEYLNNMKAPKLINTPLLLALQNRPEVIPYMIKYGADINYKDRHGNTLLHQYVHNPDMVELLLKYGSDKRIKNELGETPLDIAMKNKYDRSISLLKENQFGGNYDNYYHKYKNKYLELKLFISYD